MSQLFPVATGPHCRLPRAGWVPSHDSCVLHRGERHSFTCEHSYKEQLDGVHSYTCGIEYTDTEGKHRFTCGIELVCGWHRKSLSITKVARYFLIPSLL